MSSPLKNPNDWFAAGRIKACGLMPYFSSAVMGLVPFKAEGLGTLGVTSKGVLMWDPALAAQWTVENLAWVLLHEAGHYLRDHAGRREACAAEHGPWNIAGDCEINDDLGGAGARFPVLDSPDGTKPGGVFPKDIGCTDGKLCEEYYTHLRKQASSDGGGRGSQSKGGQKQNGNGPSKQPSGSGMRPGPLLGARGCGSGSGGEPLAAEADIPVTMGKSKAEQRRVQRAVAEAVRVAAIKSRGSVPAGLERWAEEVLGPARIPWRQKLARLCRAAVAYRAGAGDYRYDRPSRRQGAFGYTTGSPVFPALRMPVPQVAVILDTSGSMSQSDLTVGLVETQGILSAVGASVTFLACDAEVHTLKQVRSAQAVKGMLRGGGGTDMRPALEAAQRLPLRPDLVVVLTDGYIGNPGPPPRGMSVVWVVIGSFKGAPAPWGETVFLEEVK